MGNMRSRTVIILICFMFYSLLAVQAADDVDVSVKATPNPVTVDDSVLFQVIIESKGKGDIEKPVFEASDFDIVSQNSSKSGSTTIYNGQITFTRKYIYSFVLYPKKTGLLKIQNIRVKLAEGEKKADDIIVNVKKAQTKPFVRNQQGGLDSTENFESDFSVKVEVSKKRVFVGEPIVVTYYLYDYYNLRAMNVKKWPSFDGFWKEDIQIVSQYNFRPIIINGKRMRRALLGKFAIYPIKPGKFYIPKLVFQGTYTIRLRGMDNNDVFSTFFRPTRTTDRASQEIRIEAMPLPTENQPSSFSGAVGEFNASLTANKTTVEAHKPVTVKLIIEGTGNFKAIDDPGVEFPKEFEKYDSRAQTKRVKSGTHGPLHMRKEFNTLVIPRKDGQYTIDPVEWTYFDVKKRDYVTLRTSALDLNVLPGNAADSEQANNLPGGNATQQPAQPGNETRLRFLKSVDELLSGSGTLNDHIKKIFYILLTAFFVLLSFAIYRNYERMRKLVSRTETKRAKLRRLFVKAESLEGDRVWEDLEVLLYDFFSILLDENANGSTRIDREDIWISRGLPENVLSELEDHLSTCSKMRFARVSDEKTRISEVKKIISDLKGYTEKLKLD